MNVSVCMAVFNGERYLREQLSSILGQLNSDDELIIVDDCSTDLSCKIISSLNDPRILYILNKENVGVVKTFQKAIDRASGKFIFLSDQDDVWEPHKVSRSIEVMERTGAACLQTDCLLVDASGHSLGTTFFEWRGSKAGLIANWVRNSYMGCTMTFRSTLKPYILPFPEKIYMHDQWIGQIATVMGKVVFLPETLIRYRRHGNNVTTLKRARATKLIYRRIVFALAFSLRIGLIAMRKILRH